MHVAPRAVRRVGWPSVVAATYAAAGAFAMWHFMHPIVARDARLQHSHAMQKDISIIKLAMEMHESDSAGLALEFDSTRPPAWWLNSPQRRPLLPDVKYIVPRRYVGRPLDSVIGKPDFIVAQPRSGDFVASR